MLSEANFRRWIGWLLVLATIGCVPASAQHPEGLYERVSMIALIATPEKYHERRVRTEGYLSIAPPNSAIFLTSEHASDRSALNGIALTFTGSTFEGKDLSHLSGERVLIDGSYQKPAPGYELRGFMVDISAIISFED